MATKAKVKDIGFGIKAPEKTCNDKNCPFHGHIKVRGRSFVGKVIRAKMQKTVVIEFERRVYVKKYERYLKKRTRIKAHNPSCIDAREGDIVKIMETRPISKTKSSVVVQILKKAEEA